MVKKQKRGSGKDVKSSTNSGIHPYLKKENWDWGGSCCFFEHKENISEESKQKMHSDLMSLDYDPRGYLNTENKQIRRTSRL